MKMNVFFCQVLYAVMQSSYPTNSVLGGIGPEFPVHACAKTTRRTFIGL